MKQIWILTKRELRSFFDSLLAYIILVIFLLFTGTFTWLVGSDIFMRNEASLQVFFIYSYWTLFFFIPALTMRTIAEENRLGTMEMLLTKPLNYWQFIIGKFLATMLLIAVALAFTLPYYITVANIGPIDHGTVWTGYLGLLLMSATYTSIGIFSSSLSNNQIVAFLIALTIGIFFHWLFGIFAGVFSGFLASLSDYLSLSTHFESISRGVIDTKDIIYFLSLIFVGLISTNVVLERKYS